MRWAPSQVFRIWLGGTVRRWLAVASVVATVAGSVAFVATEHLAPMLLVVVGLFVLVLVLGSEQYDTQRARLQELLPLERLIADGRAILCADDECIRDWPDWVERASGYLIKEGGLQALYDFRRVSDGYDPSGGSEGALHRPRPGLTFSSSRECLKAQLAELERLRRGLS